MMRLFYFTILFFCSINAGISQFYQIYGPQTISQCNFETNSYFIETSEQLDSTIWEIIPTPGAQIFGTVYSAEVVFNQPGSYLLFATSFTANGEFFTDSIVIYVEDFLYIPEVLGCYEIDGRTGCYQVCAFSQTIIDLGFQSTQWQVTGAESYSFDGGSQIEINWGAGGKGYVSVYLQGCSVDLCFDILPEPVADFSTSPGTNTDTLTICKNQEVYFENESQNGIDYHWNFGDGAMSDDYDVSHTYSMEGYYTVTLSAETVCACSSEKVLVIEVLPAPAPTLDCVNSVCPETRQRYTATTAGCTNYTWSVSPNGTIINGGEANDDFIEIIWHEGPDGFIDLSVSGCITSFCSFTNRFRVPIITPDGPVDGDESVCSGEIATYTAPYFPGTTYQWQIGPAGIILGNQNKNAITVKWNDVSSITNTFVEVTYENCFLECGGSDNLSVNITPEINLSGDAQVCQNEIASVQATAGFITPMAASVQWQLKDPSGTVIASSPGMTDTWNYTFSVPAGIYTWVAINNSNNYCTEIATLDIEVTETPASPVAILGETEICPGQAYGYTIESAGNFATIWTITDGANTTTYSGNTCQHTFGIAPPFIVEAYHTDIQYASCASGSIALVLSSAADLVIEGPDDGCFNAIDMFSTKYVSGTEYLWEVIPADHGEIRKSNLNEVEVFWSQTGPVTLRLNACGAVIDKPIMVHALPVFNVLGPMAACSNVTVNLTTDQPTLDHVWINENNTILSLLDNHSFYPGSYAVALTDNYGCTDKESFTITSFPAPKVHLSSPYGNYFCGNIPGGLQITANTDGPDYQYTWFKDEVMVPGAGPVYTVTSFGSYHVEVSNQYGCVTVSKKISYQDCCAPNVCNAPGGGGGFPAGCTFIPADFMVSKSELSCEHHEFTPNGADMTPGQIQWIVRSISQGVLGLVNTDVLDFTYTDPGYYFIEVFNPLTGFPYGVDQCGHYDELIDTVKAVADFKHEGICADAPIDFEDLTTFLPGESITSWSWNFDDPSSGVDNASANQDPSHTFANAGTYNVELIITLASGCISSKTIQVKVSDGPPLNPLYALEYCEDEAMAFRLPGNLFNVDWDFGDPGSAAENTAVTDSVFHTYINAGLYTVNVAASDINQCRSQTDFIVEIKQNTLNGIIDVDPNTPLCTGDTAVLTAPAGGLSWTWSTGETSASIQVAESSQYNVLVKDQYQCSYSPPAVFVEVFPKPVVTIKAREIVSPGMFGAWSSNLMICVGTEFEIQAFSIAGVSYQWSHGPTTSTLQFTTEGANLPGPGSYEFKVHTIDLLSGCISDSSLILIEVFDLPDVPVIAVMSGSLCSFDNNVLEVTNPQADVDYVWSDGQTGTVITAMVEGPYSVEAINEHGCNSLSNTILIKPSAQVDQIPGGCFIECDPLEVCLPPINNVASYTIYQNGSVYLSGVSWPSNFQITDDGSYTIEVTTNNGCTATSDPLDVLLYTGVGSITVETWLDADGNGVISAGDILIPGIPVEILSDDGLYEGGTETIPGGQFVFTDYPAQGYLASINRVLLPSIYTVVIDSVQTNITTCGDSVVVSLLITDNCIVTGPDDLYDLCPGETVMVGDSSWMETGNFTMHMMSSSGCDSVFQVVITAPDSLDIFGQVWVDVDHDGTISMADTLISGISMLLTDISTNTSDMLVTDGNGSVHWYDQLEEYRLEIDTANLAANFIPILFDTIISDTSCGSISIDFLIESACSPIFIILQESLCSGDSVFIENQWISDEGQYTFIHTDPLTSCDTIIDVYVTLNEEIIVESTVEWNCLSMGTITLNVSGEGPFAYQWNPPFSGDTLLTGLQDGDYTVFITDANGCNSTETYTVIGSPELFFEVQDYFLIEDGESVYIEITGDIDENGLVFEWFPADILDCSTCPAATATPNETTTFGIIITDTNGCVYNLQTIVVVLTDTTGLDGIYVPNVFSPNNDGINDLWTIFSKHENTQLNNLTIYDRWGNMVYTKKEFLLNAFDGWDGTKNGQPLNPGVFVFHAVLTLSDGKQENIHGNITLVR